MPLIGSGAKAQHRCDEAVHCCVDTVDHFAGPSVWFGRIGQAPAWQYQTPDDAATAKARRIRSVFIAQIIRSLSQYYQRFGPAFKFNPPSKGAHKAAVARLGLVLSLPPDGCRPIVPRPGRSRIAGQGQLELWTPAVSFGKVDGMTVSRLSEDEVRRFKRAAWPYLPVLLRTARYFTRRDDEAEDLVQDVMLKAMRAMDSFQDGTDMKAWLMTILRRTFIDRVRSMKRRQKEVSLATIEDVANDEKPAGVFDDNWDHPEQILDRFEDQAVIDALKALPDAIRWTLLLVDVEQMEQTETATILDVPVGTIKSRTHRGRKMLRDRLYQVAQERGWVAIGERQTP